MVVVRAADQFLVIRRAEHIPAGGAWCFVGGAIEPGETQRGAVVREFAEEVTGVVTPRRKIWELRNLGHNLLLHWWLADLQDARLEANPAEVAELRWCRLAEIQRLPNLLESNRLFVAGVCGGEISLA